MKYLITFLDKLILSKKEAIFPIEGRTASYFSTKYDRFC